MKKSVAEVGPFSNEFLKKEGSSLNYLNDVKYDIPLKDLFQIKDTLYKDQRVDFCPIILEVKSKELTQTEYYGSKYLVQIWNKNGIMKL